MAKTITNHNGNSSVVVNPIKLTNSDVELVSDVTISEFSEKAIALQTTKESPITTEIKGDSAFGGFNLGLHVGDNAVDVNHNRDVLNNIINNASNNSGTVNIQWLEQVHGNNVVEINSVTNEPLIADASITRQKNIALAIMTADCLPILLCNDEGNEIAAIHGGWRSLAANIINKTLARMSSKPNNILAWLGPCIGSRMFEVGEEVKAAFVSQSTCFNDAFEKQSNGKYLANLHKIAKIQLKAAGINTIESREECTYSNTDKYYSYRKNAKTGRMATVICLR